MRLYIKVKLEDIVVQNRFLNHTPRKDKIDRYRNTYEKYKAFRKLPVVDKNLVLIDGYIPYLLMKEYGFDEIFVIKDTETSLEDTTNTMYIYGTHVYGFNDKVYIWKVPKKDCWDKFRENVRSGDIIKCNTSLGERYVMVEDIEVSDIPPKNGKIKTVCTPSIYIIDEDLCDIEDMLVRG